MATIAVIAVLAYLAGRAIKPADPAAGMAQQTPLPAAAAEGDPAPVRGPDISQLSPGERAERLYRRVMLLDSQGKSDSVLFFAPMALDAYGMLSQVDSAQSDAVSDIRTALAAAQRRAGTTER